MSPFTLDLSGRGGLAPRFWGDIDRTVAVPNLRYLGADGQMADGIYNPFRRYGYMSPANATFNAVTDGSTANFTSLMSCSVYDANNDDFYYGMYQTGIYKGDTLDDVALALQSNPPTGSSLSDLEIYQINGVQKLFYVYSTNSPTGFSPTVSYSSSGLWRLRYGVIAPAASSIPVVQYSTTDFQVGSSATMTTSITIPVSTNSILIVFCYCNESTAATPVTATYNGGAMVRLSSNTSNMAGGTFALLAPTTGSHNVVVTWPSSVANRVMHVVVANNAAQVSEAATVSAGATTGTSTLATVSGLTIAANSLTLVSADTNQLVSQAIGPLQTDLATTQRTSTCDSLSEFIPTGSNYFKVGIADLPFANPNDIWLNATVNGQFTNATTGQSFMEVADNGFAYLFQDNVVHKIDGTTGGGTNGTLTANVLIFPTYFRIVDAVDYRGLIFIAVHQYPTDTRSIDDTVISNSLKTGVYLWDRLTSATTTRDYIPITGIKEIRKLYISPSGKLRAIVINSERVVEIREYNGSTFEPIQEVGYNSYPAFRDSLTTFNGITTWLGRDGLIYAHGTIVGGEKEVLYKIGKLTNMSTNAVSAGAILFGGANVGSTTAGFKNQRNGLYLSYYDGSHFLVKEWDMYGTGSSGSPSASNLCAQGDVYTLVKYLPQMSTVENIEIFMYPSTGSGSTTAGTLKIYFNNSATPWASKVITQDQAARGYANIEVNKPYINSVQLEVEFNTAATIGAVDFSPSVAVVNTASTSTKG